MTNEQNKPEPAEPRKAAAVILLRQGGELQAEDLQVLLVKRSPEARFMPNVWVFPGGAVDSGDREETPDDIQYRRAAMRELLEEAGIELEDSDALIPFSRWITPTEIGTRYDAHFYIALAPQNSHPEPDGREAVDAGWFNPSEALKRHQRGEMGMVFPTIKHLEELACYKNADQLLEAAPERSMEPVRPRAITVGGESRIVLPGEPGYGA